ncbi:MAG TPA: hypothetical protein VGI81_26350 [Tepidisphaeraceae bacterium]|jgi:hypothetical protein
MLRRIFGLLAALLFALCLALATLWVREEPRLPAPKPIPLPRGVVMAPSVRSIPPDVDLAKPMWGVPPFRGRPLPVALNRLFNAEAGPIETNWPRLKAAGIGFDTPVPRQTAPGDALGSMLADVLTPMGLAFATDGHVVYVSTPADVARLGHMRHVDRFAFVTQADGLTAQALASERTFVLRQRPLIRIETDGRALRAAGAEFRVPIGWSSYTPTGMLLEQVLRDASATTPLRYQIRGGRVVISTAAAFEAADRRCNRLIALSMISVLVALCALMVLTRRRPGLGRFLCAAVVLIAAIIVCIPVWRARPDSISARIGRSRWTVGLGPQRSFVLSREPARLEEVFMSHRSGGPGRAVYCDRLGFYAAREGPPFQVFNAHAPRGAMIGLAGTLPFLWAAFNSTSVLTLPGRLRDRRRARTGRCLGCGYDLRGCPSDRCPECGGAIP